MKTWGIRPEIEAFDLSMIFKAVEMQQKGQSDGPLHAQFVMGVKNAMPVDREVFAFYVQKPKRLAPDATWTGAGIGRDQITLNHRSLELGGIVGQVWKTMCGLTGPVWHPPTPPWLPGSRSCARTITAIPPPSAKPARCCSFECTGFMKAQGCQCPGRTVCGLDHWSVTDGQADGSR